MNGILVDVSASMSTAYYLGDAACSDVSVQRTHALFTTIFFIFFYFYFLGNTINMTQ